MKNSGIEEFVTNEKKGTSAQRHAFTRKALILRTEFISVIIPAYNESLRIIPTISRIFNYLSGHFPNFEIIIVDDGSRDDTSVVVSRVQEELESVKLIRYETNRGKGYAIRKGVIASAGDLILISDADLSTPIEEVEKLLVQYDLGHDVAIGSRALKKSLIEKRQPFWREWMGKIFNTIVRYVVLDDFRDTQCGFKLFRGTVGREIFTQSKIDRFAYDVEILHLAKKSGYTIQEVPVRWLNSPESKVKPVRDSLQTLKDLFKIRFRS